ncbi:MAG: hypothetical protein ACLUEV_11990 [Alistipes sp.]
MNLVLEGTIRPIRYRFLGRRSRTYAERASSARWFRCELATSTGESFEDGSEFTIWISDDRTGFRSTSVADPRRVDPRATDKLEKPEVSAG